MTAFAHARDANLPDRPWSVATRGAYEVWYGKVTGRCEGQPRALWFRYTLECPGATAPPVATCWAAWFDEAQQGPPFLLTRDFVVPRLDPGPPFEVRFSDQHALVEDPENRGFHALGDLRDGDARITWDLRYRPAAPVFPYMAHETLRRWVSPSGACSPVPHARFEGVVRVVRPGQPEEVLEVQDAPGMQGHIWGTRKAHSWAWAHGNDWIDHDDGHPVDAAFEILHVRRRPNAMPLTTMYLWLEGEHHVFNGLRDLVSRRAWLIGEQRVGNRAELGSGRLDFERPGFPELRGHFQLRPRQTLEVEYHDTDGSTLRNRNATLADASLVVQTRRGRRRLVAPGTATLEVVDRG